MKSTQSEVERPGASARTTLRRGLRRRKEGTERGAVLVETVFILPILILLVFGVIEISLAYQAAAKVTDASRAVGRTMAALGTDADAPNASANAAQAALSSLPKTATPVTMLIYKPNSQNLPGAATSLDPLDIAMGCLLSSSTCTIMHWDGDEDSFVQSYFPLWGVEVPIRWNVSTDEVCGPDYGRLGVIVFSSYEPITNLFSDTLRRDGRLSGDGDTGINPDFDPMWDRSIFTFDPDLSAECT